MNAALALAALALGAIGCVLAIWAELRLRRAESSKQSLTERLWVEVYDHSRTRAKLLAIHRQRSETTRRGNATRRARILAVAAQIDRETGRVG